MICYLRVVESTFVFYIRKASYFLFRFVLGLFPTVVVAIEFSFACSLSSADLIFSVPIVAGPHPESTSALLDVTLACSSASNLLFQDMESSILPVPCCLFFPLVLSVTLSLGERLKDCLLCWRVMLCLVNPYAIALRYSATSCLRVLSLNSNFSSGLIAASF